MSDKLLMSIISLARERIWVQIKLGVDLVRRTFGSLLYFYPAP